MAPAGCKRRIMRSRDIVKESSNPVIAAALIILTADYFCVYGLLAEIARVQHETAEAISRIEYLRQQIAQEEKKARLMTPAVQCLQSKTASPSCMSTATQTDETPAEESDEAAVLVHILIASKHYEKVSVAADGVLAPLREVSFSALQSIPLVASARTSAGGLSDDLQAPEGDHAASKAKEALKLLKKSFASKSFKALGVKLADAFTRPSQTDANDVGPADRVLMSTQFHSNSVVHSSPLTCKKSSFWGCFRPLVVS